MSAEAELFVERLVRSGEGAALRLAERNVLSAVAFFHDPRRGYAYPSMARLAQKALVSVSTAQRAMARLVEGGRVRRHEVWRDKDGGQASNEYELVGFADAAGEPGGSVQAAQAGLQERQEQGQDEADTAAVRRSHQVTHRTAAKRQGRTRARRAVQGLLPVESGRFGAVESSRIDRGEGVTRCEGGGCQQVTPREVRKEENAEEKPTPTPALVPGVEEKLPVKPRAKASATARATATATTAAVRNPEAGHGPGGPGRSSLAGAAGCPGRAGGEPAADSVDALLRAEARRVLVVAGVAPETATRRTWAAVEEALRLRMQQPDAGGVGGAGDLAVRRWREYQELAGRGLLRWGPCGVRKFFGDGWWLNQARWGVDREKAGRAGR